MESSPIGSIVVPFWDYLYRTLNPVKTLWTLALNRVLTHKAELQWSQRVKESLKETLTEDLEGSSQGSRLRDPLRAFFKGPLEFIGLRARPLKCPVKGSIQFKYPKPYRP